MKFFETMFALAPLTKEEALSFGYHVVEDFGMQRSLRLSWHLLLALSSCLALIYDLMVSTELEKFLIFCTSWSLLLSCTTAIAQALLTLSHSRLQPPKEDDESALLSLSSGKRLLWLLLVTNTNLSLFVTIYYWLLVYPSLVPEAQEAHMLDKFLAHGLIPAMLVVDVVFFSAGRRIRLRHGLPALLFLTCYDLFTLIYFLAGGRGLLKHATPEHLEHGGNPYIYSSIDWRSPSTVLLVNCVAAIKVVLIQMFLVLLDKLAQQLWTRDPIGNKKEL